MKCTPQTSLCVPSSIAAKAWTWRHWLLLACAVGFGRAIFGWFDYGALQQDIDGYAPLAVNLAESGTFGFRDQDGFVKPTAFRPPLYPWLLSWIVQSGSLKLGGVFVLHWTISVWTSMLAASVAYRMRIPHPLLVGLLVAADPLLLRAGSLVMTELLATFLGLLAWWIWLVLCPCGDHPVLCPCGDHPCPCSDHPTGKGQVLCPYHTETVKPVNSGELQIAGALRRAGNQVSLRMAAVCSLGLVMGVSVLCRPTAAAWCVLMVGGMLLWGRRCWKQRFLDVAVVSLGVVSLVIPWSLRNLEILGKPVWGTTHGGYTLLLANNPLLYQHFRQHGPDRNWNADPFHLAWAARGKGSPQRLLQPDYWLDYIPVAKVTPDAAVSPLAANVKTDAAVSRSATDTAVSPSAVSPSASAQASVPVVHGLGELNDDRLAYAVAFQTIRQDPAQFLLGCLYRLGWLWSCWPSSSGSGGVGFTQQAAIGGWYVVIYILAAMGLYLAWKRGAWPVQVWLPGLSLLIALSVVHCFYWSNMRMRCPAMPCIYILVVLAIERFDFGRMLSFKSRS